MKKHLLIIGILLSLSASVLAQEKKTLKFSHPKVVKFVWDIVSPVYTQDGDTITYLTIATIQKIEDISFRIEWHCSNGKVLSTSEKAILRYGSIAWENDRPDVFATDGIWYNVYILPSPHIASYELKKIKFSGSFLAKSYWNNMGLNEAIYHK